ncbi:hypothetical protein MPL1032_240272 [Mesorhizobium plurifarium]|uniref:Uncharacterized protein n=1 Tax=Mesorhizobium plurifarium TaxID=69974 RepID=A0A0K2W1G4_MESPL|nr:hypothetical protein MPL1032_240272 [Mesorhizobium plurifarium]
METSVNMLKNMEHFVPDGMTMYTNF